jgi:hypothetical protein
MHRPCTQRRYGPYARRHGTEVLRSALCTRALHTVLLRRSCAGYVLHSSSCREPDAFPADSNRLPLPTGASYTAPLPCRNHSPLHPMELTRLAPTPPAEKGEVHVEYALVEKLLTKKKRGKVTKVVGTTKLSFQDSEGQLKLKFMEPITELKEVQGECFTAAMASPLQRSTV